MNKINEIKFEHVQKECDLLYENYNYKFCGLRNLEDYHDGGCEERLCPIMITIKILGKYEKNIQNI